MILEISDPVETLKKIALFFQDRQILIDNLQLYRYREGNAAHVIIHCCIEKDRIHRTIQLMQQLPGIFELEWMEAKR